MTDKANIYKELFYDAVLEKLQEFRSKKTILFPDACLDKDCAIECSARTKVFVYFLRMGQSHNELLALFHGLTNVFMDLDKK